MRVITICNPRRGVGRTTTALNLAAALGRRGQRTLAIDLAADAELSRALGVEAENPLDSAFGFLCGQGELADVARITASGIIVAPGSADLTRVDRLIGKGPTAISRLRRELAKAPFHANPVVVDCGPTLDVPALNAVLAADVVVAPIDQDFDSVASAQTAWRAVRALGAVTRRTPEFRVFVSRQDAAGLLARQLDELLETTFLPEQICRARTSRSAATLDRPAIDPARAGEYDVLGAELLVAAGLAAGRARPAGDPERRLAGAAIQ